MTGNSIVINAEIDAAPDKIYVYENRNEAVYLINVKNMERKDDATMLFIDSGTEFFELSAAENIKIDIPIGEITLFERVFLKGGKING